MLSSHVILKARLVDVEQSQTGISRHLLSNESGYLLRIGRHAEEYCHKYEKCTFHVSASIAIRQEFLLQASHSLDTPSLADRGS